MQPPADADDLTLFVAGNQRKYIPLLKDPKIRAMRTSDADAGNGLLVSEGVNRIFASGHPCRIERTDKSSSESDDGTLHQPFPRDLKMHGRGMQKDRANEIGTCYSQPHAYDGHDSSFTQYDPDDLHLRRAERLEYADLTRAFENGGVHGLEDDKEAHNHGYRRYHFEGEVEAGQFLRRHHRKPLAHGPNRIILESGGVVD